MSRYLSIAVVLLLSTGKSIAQLNESDTAKFQLRASLTGSYQQGNVEVLNIKSRLEFSVAAKRQWVFKSQNSSLYQAFYSKKADNDIFSRNYVYYKPANRVYPFAIAYLSANYRRKINNRYFAGAGVTWQAVNTGRHVLKFSASTVYEATKFTRTTYNDSRYNGRDAIELWRGTLFAAGWHYLLERHLRLYYDAYWQPAFNNGGNYRTQLDLGIDFPVWKGLSLNALFAYTHENVVVTNILPDDKILTFGLAYNFKKK